MFTSKKLKARILELEQANRILHKKQFRVGDCVYVNDGKHDPTIPYYLRKSYNDGGHYYVSQKRNDIVTEDHTQGIDVAHLSKEPPTCCNACGQLVNK